MDRNKPPVTIKVLEKGPMAKYYLQKTWKCFLCMRSLATPHFESVSSNPNPTHKKYVLREVVCPQPPWDKYTDLVFI